jgi:hypothetical protein
MDQCAKQNDVLHHEKAREKEKGQATRSGRPRLLLHLSF